MYYVCMKDNFMSGWGKAKSKINYYVIECDTIEQAETIYRNAELRGEMSDVSIKNDMLLEDPSRWVISTEHYDELGAIWKK